jgi:HSP20 family protein
MANIRRVDPLNEAFNDLLRGFFVRPMALEANEPGQFKMDVKEDERAYTVHAELPGVKKEDIDVSIDGSQVSVSAEVKGEKEQKDGERLLRRERFYGKVARAFDLGQTIDEAGAEAKFADGVLELTLPKKAVVSAKRVSVQ